MKTSTARVLLAILVPLALFAASCGSSSDSEGSETTTSETTTSETTTSKSGTTVVDTESSDGEDTVPTEAATNEAATSDAATGIDVGLFFDGALTEDVTTQDCTLGGTTTSCYELTIAGFPATLDGGGPSCPATTSATAEEGGIWFDGDAVYDIDGQFILDLAEIYDDPTWKLYDDEGNVLSTDTSEAFNELVTGGPQADADAGPVNLCVYGEIDWSDAGGPTPATVQIPVTPVVAASPSPITTRVGITLDGVLIEGSAPVDLILGNYTIGAFDDCGGHVNPQEGYHLHGTTGCSDSTAAVPEGETALFGYALDGFGIRAPYEPSVEAEAGLDECNGHETAELGYHYHANQIEKNAVLSCLVGETTESATGGAAGGPPGDRPAGDRPAAAAQPPQED